MQTVSWRKPIALQLVLANGPTGPDRAQIKCWEQVKQIFSKSSKLANLKALEVKTRLSWIKKAKICFKDWTVWQH